MNKCYDNGDCGVGGFCEDCPLLKIKCSECGEECKLIEETFDYAGAHCTNGKSGTHHTGIYVSDCCFAEPEES